MTAIVQKRTWSRQSLIPALIGLAICYSIAYNYLLYNAVQNDVSDDAECAAIPVGDGHESPLCSEMRLFRAWHDADVMRDESEASLLAVAPNASMADGLSAVEVQGKGMPSISQQETTPMQAIHGETQLVDEMTSEAKEVEAAEHRRLQEAQLRQQQFDALEKEVRASLNQRSVTPWAKHLMDEQKRMEAESAALERRHTDRVLAHWQTDIDRLASQIQALVHSDVEEAPWKTELANLKQLIQHAMGANSSMSVEHEEKVFALRHIQLDKLEEGLRGTPRSNVSAPVAQLGSLAFQIKHLRTRLELEMSTRAMQGSPGKKTAADLGDRATKLESSLTDLVLHHKAWEENFVTQDSAPAHTSSSGRLRGAQSSSKEQPVKVEPAIPKPVGFMDKRLHWSSVTKMSHSVVTGAAHDVRTTVSKSDLRHLQWGGFIPKVACISTISYSSHTKARMMYFIDNFKLQSYEGPKELVLVYSHADTQAAKLVQKYTDGVYIKSVAARDDRDFPSSAALRYGAWSTDADVVARWEFDEWHDPKRLSMQVRAMAAASKPACILQRTDDKSRNGSEPDESPNSRLSFHNEVLKAWRIFQEFTNSTDNFSRQVLKGTERKTDQKAETFVQEASLIGERSWMKAYWQPLISEDNVNMVPPPPAHLVQLDMSTPQPKKDDTQEEPVSKLRGATTQEANLKVEHKTTGIVEAAQDGPRQVQAVHAWTMEDCLNFDTNITGLTSDTELAIDKNLGHGMSKTFHKLAARRRDITQRLVLLCIETTMRSDTQEIIFKREHVEQMLGIREELDKHISGIVSLFADKSLLSQEADAASESAQGRDPSAKL